MGSGLPAWPYFLSGMREGTKPMLGHLRPFLRLSMMVAAMSVSMSIAHSQSPAPRVLAGGAAQPVLRALGPELAARIGTAPELVFGVVGALQQRLASGEKADLVLLPEPLLTALEQSGKLRFVKRQTLARVGIGVVMKAGAPVPDLASAASLKQIVAGARTIVHSDPKVTPGGAHMTKVLTELGVSPGTGPQVIHKNAIDGGAEMVARGEADVGFFLVTEVKPVAGVTLAGLLPDALQSWVVYGIGVVAGSAQEKAALELAAYLAAPEIAARWRAAGFDLVAH